MDRGRWLMLGAGSTLVATFFATATSFSLQSAERDWGPHARAAAQRLVSDRAPDGGGLEFADVEVRRNGNDDERWVCGSFAARDEEGALSPFRDFWITVARIPKTWADIQDVRANDFGRDDFFDRNSAHFQACFADGETG